MLVAFGLPNRNKQAKTFNIGCAEAIIPLANRKGSLQVLHSDCSVCIVAICYI